MIRMLCLIGGLTGAAGLSQFPEFSQQYLQRLGGQVDELTRQVKAFDADALAEGLGREEALELMAGEAFVERRQISERAMFARHARLSENLVILRAASPMERLMLPHRMADGSTMAAAWADFKPALPLSMAGVTAAGAGFLGGWVALAMLVGLIAAPFRRIRHAKNDAPRRREPAMRQDPPVTRPTLVTDTSPKRPRLAGVQR